MYSYEIQMILEENNYIIDSNTYIKICNKSPQISSIKYNPYTNHFKICTNDNFQWEFSVNKENSKYF